MWSGPRNISTALLRSWGNRADTFVTDEPFYAHYLKANPVNHPGVDDIIADGETDWRRVVGWLTGPVPQGKTVWYQKHMAHHLLPDLDLDWIDSLTNCLLIREPREMLTSLLAVMPDPGLADTGLPQQFELFERIRRQTGAAPAVVDARDVLQDPAGLLSRLCAAAGLAFSEAMLEWPSGSRETDGIWAKHWYANVERSTRFAPYSPKGTPLPEDFGNLLRECEEIYEEIYPHRLTV